jgi:hypothetical protein
MLMACGAAFGQVMHPLRDFFPLFEISTFVTLEGLLIQKSYFSRDFWAESSVSSRFDHLVMFFGEVIVWAFKFFACDAAALVRLPGGLAAGARCGCCAGNGRPAS